VAKLTHPHPRELGATRFFARLIAFDLECPRCGKVFRIRRLNRQKMAAYALDEGVHHTWNPATARFTCTGKDGCQKQYVLGMLAWDPSLGARSGAIPTDQVPTYRQLAELRQDGQGHWMPHQLRGRMNSSNLAVSEERGEDHDDGEDEIE
jgi:hypothetical protein